MSKVFRAVLIHTQEHGCILLRYTGRSQYSVFILLEVTKDSYIITYSYIKIKLYNLFSCFYTKKKPAHILNRLFLVKKIMDLIDIQQTQQTLKLKHQITLLL